MIRLLTVFLLPAFVFAQKSESDRLENYLTAFRAVNEFSGVVLIVKENKIFLKKVFGFSDLENKIPNSTETRFRIASCSKQFTAIAIHQLQEKNKVSVTDLLSKYFPNIPGSSLITLDMLLTHRSGIHDLYADSAFPAINTPNLTVSKILEMMRKNNLDFPPGAKHSYSNSGYFLLSLIIEKVSGVPRSVKQTGLSAKDPSEIPGLFHRCHPHFAEPDPEKDQMMHFLSCGK
jgi:CubicO group peptidase (beta-lactamase class C family)